MNKSMPLEVLYPILFTFVGTFLLSPFYIIFFPLFIAYNWFVPGQFLESGYHVDLFFPGIIINSIEAWFFFGSFFFLLGLAVGTFKYCSRASKQKLWLRAVVIILVLAIAIRTLLDAIYFGLYP
jgi:hypothetical protein